MMRTVFAGLLICAPMASQPDHWASSPRGLDFVEGGLSFDLIGKERLLRFQQIDATNDLKMNRNRVAFRRDGTSPLNIAYRERTVDLEIRFAEGNLQTATTSFDGNYLRPHAVVFQRKQVSFPNWIVPPINLPAEHDLILMLDTIWHYLGKQATGNDFLWEVRVWDSSLGGQSYPMDGDLAQIPSSLSTKISLGLGCTATGAPGDARLFTKIFNYRTHFYIESLIFQSAANAQSALLYGLRDDNHFSPMLCSTLHVLPAPPNAAVPVGQTSGVGHIRFGFNMPYAPQYIGQSIYTQGATLDAGQPVPIAVALTDGNQNLFPADPPATSQVIHMFSTDPDATTASSGIQPGGIILMTNHL